MVGAEQTEVDARASRARTETPAFGSLWFHNEKEKPTVEAAATGAAEGAETEGTLRRYANTPTGMPSHILGSDFQAGSRAIAQGSEDPAYMRGRGLQRRIGGLLRFCCALAVDTAYLLAPERFAGVEDWTIEIEYPSLLHKNPADAAPVLGSITGSLESARAQKLIDHQSAQEVFVRAVNELGLAEVDLDTVRERLGAEPATANPYDAAAMDRLRRAT